MFPSLLYSVHIQIVIVVVQYPTLHRSFLNLHKFVCLALSFIQRLRRRLHAAILEIVPKPCLLTPVGVECCWSNFLRRNALLQELEFRTSRFTLADFNPTETHALD